MRLSFNAEKKYRKKRNKVDQQIGYSKITST